MKRYRKPTSIVSSRKSRFGKRSQRSQGKDCPPSPCPCLPPPTLLWYVGQMNSCRRARPIPPPAFRQRPGATRSKVLLISGCRRISSRGRPVSTATPLRARIGGTDSNQSSMHYARARRLIAGVRGRAWPGVNVDSTSNPKSDAFAPLVFQRHTPADRQHVG